MTKIFAFVLTYNRKDLLDRCLEAVFAQSRPCERVIVVDNGSSDGTEAMLREKWGPRVDVHILSQNIGAAGGFNAGMRIAYQEGADFLWVMDDDVIPAPDALEKLVEADQFLALKGIGRSFVISSAWTEDDQVTNVPKVDTRHNARGYENWPLLLEHKLIPVIRSTFISILLPRSTLTEYGVPVAPMFIWGEDSEFTYRITKRHPGYMVADSKALHLRQLGGMISVVTETNPARLRYHRYLIRNQIYVARVHLSKLDFLRYMIRRLQLIARLVKDGAWRKAGIVGMGLIDSLTFRPSIEAADAPMSSLGTAVRRVAFSAELATASIAPADGGVAVVNSLDFNKKVATG